jgi:glutamate-1-semialdehyde 2,1-aminomutase
VSARSKRVKKQTILQRYTTLSPASERWYAQARELFPGGVTHDARFLTPYPIYVDRAAGSRKWDVEGREYIDYWSGHGALLLGHGCEEVLRAVHEQLDRGTHLGACHPLEIRWAALVTELVPSAGKVRFTASGTEATMMGIRLARTLTGRKKLLKFAGHFHGWHDQVMPGVNPPYEAHTPGVLREVVDATIVCPPNDIHVLERVLERDPDIACIIIEPTGASFGAIPTDDRFLKPLREAADRHGVILIFDEVISGFRVAPGGAQTRYGVVPDLTALAKILAGGFPGGALAGRHDLMELLEVRDDPQWMGRYKMPHPGTFNANPVSAAAGIATLELLRKGEPNRLANEAASRLRDGMNRVIDSHRLNWCVYGSFSEFRYLIGHDMHGRRASDIDPYEIPYTRLKGSSDPLLLQALRRGMLLNGVDVPMHGGLTMSAHSRGDIDHTVEAFSRTLSSMKDEGLF